jgi:hypothetical protein
LVGLGNLAAARLAPVAIAADPAILSPVGEGELPLVAIGGNDQAVQRRSVRLPVLGAVALTSGLAGALLWLGRRSPTTAELPPLPKSELQPEAQPETEPPPSSPLATTRLSREAVVDSLVQDLAHSDGSVRRHAVWALGQRGNSDAITPLIDRLLEADSQEKSLILAALAEISSRSLKPMHRALALGLQDPSPEVRKNAIRDLSRVYDTVVQLSAMLAHAAQDPDPSVQETARWALGQLSRIPAAPYAPVLPAEVPYDSDRLPPG